MIIMNYLEKHLILDDLIRHSQALTERYEVIAAPLVRRFDHEYMYFGFFVYSFKHKRNFSIYNTYHKDEIHDKYDQRTSNWSVEDGGGISSTSYKRSIGDVMKELKIKERDIAKS